MESVKSHKFADRPGYEEYRAMFRELFLRCGYASDYRFDWNELRRPRPRAQKTQTYAQRVSVFKQASAAVLTDHGRRPAVISNPRLVPKEGKANAAMGRTQSSRSGFRRRRGSWNDRVGCPRVAFCQRSCGSRNRFWNPESQRESPRLTLREITAIHRSRSVIFQTHTTRYVWSGG
jgi:hypothetical protein